MRAPVYRNIDTPNTLLGLSFPLEVVFLLFVFYLTVRVSIGVCVGATIATYVALRVLGYGRTPGFLQHWVAWQVRQLWSSGLLSAAGRARAPRFPFAPYVFRDPQPVAEDRRA